jgi:nucleoside-diphosphate-sugar epimerase
MRVLVAGASGVIGRSLLPHLAKEGHDVIGTTRSAGKSGLLHALGARPVVVDAFNRDALFTLLRRERPQAVIHMLTSLHAGDFAANTRLRIEGTRNLVDAARDIGVARIVAESFCLYAPAPGLAKEEDPLDLQSGVYGGAIEGILALEKVVADIPEHVILRYGMLYGPGAWFARDGSIADQIRSGTFVATGDIASFVYVEDAARAAVLALTWPSGTINIADDEPAPATEWAPVLAALIGAPPPRVKEGPGNFRGVSNAKARCRLGWQPLYPSWRQGFQSVFRSFSRRTSGSAAV